MPDYTWNDTFEANPEDTDEIKYGANEIRDLKKAVRERGELEHEFKTGTSPFHKAGLCSILYRETTANITALANKVANGLYWDTDLQIFKSYDGANVVSLEIKHSGLANLTDEDDHTQYVHTNKANQTLEQNLLVTEGITIDGYDISVIGNIANTANANGIAWVFLANLSNLAQYTNTQDWTALATGLTANETKTVILYVQAFIGRSYSGAGSQYAAVEISFRATGAGGIGPGITVCTPAITTTINQWCKTSGQVFVPCDANASIDCKIANVGTIAHSNLTVNVWCVGHIDAMKDE